MKKALAIATFLLFSIFSFSQTKQKSIIDDLNEYKEGQGSVRVMQDESINKVIGVNKVLVDPSSLDHFDERVMLMGRVDFVRVRGWKIQVFSGNRQQESKQEAETKRETVRTAFPMLEATVTYNTPMWRLRVGNFVEREVAEHKLVELKKALPTLAKEMYLVQDTVKQPVEN